MVERVLVVYQRILRGEQADIRVCDVQQLHDRFRPVHAKAPALDDPFLAHPRESGEGALARNLELPHLSICSSQGVRRTVLSGEGSCTKTLASASRPSRCKLSSIERFTPSAV